MADNVFEALTNLGDAIREKTGKTDKMTLDQMTDEILSIQVGEGGAELPELDNPGDGSKLRKGYQLIGADGQIVEGEMPEVEAGKPSIFVQASGLIRATTHQAEGYVADTETVAEDQLPTQAAKVVHPGLSYQVAAPAGVFTTGDVRVAPIATVEQAFPSVLLNSKTGLVRATVTQPEGYVVYGTREGTLQLTVQEGKLIEPHEGGVTAVESNRYTTGPVLVEGFQGVADEVRALMGQSEEYSLAGMETAVQEANEVVAQQAELIEQIKTALAGKGTAGGGNGLPDGYSRCDYIRFEGKQIVDTGIICNETSRIMVQFTRELSSQHYLFGVASSNNTASVTAYLGGSWRFGDKSSSRSLTAHEKALFTAIMDATGIALPNSSTTFSDVEAFETIGTLLLGACRNSSGTVPTVGSYAGNISLMELWDGDEVVRKLIPVVSEDGVYRFFDEVSEEFFDSITSTALKGGDW